MSSRPRMGGHRTQSPICGPCRWLISLWMKTARQPTSGAESWMVTGGCRWPRSAPTSDCGMPPAIAQYVLKVHSRCDLACDHCYVYESADQSWHGRPLAISDEVISQTALRIAEHARSHRLDGVQVVLHGGEPLLAGRARLRRIVTELKTALHG